MTIYIQTKGHIVIKLFDYTSCIVKVVDIDVKVVDIDIPWLFFRPVPNTSFYGKATLKRRHRG